MSEGNSNRMAELAFEMMGAKLAKEMMVEAVASASPEAKRALADALYKTIADRLQQSGSFEIQRIADEIARGMLNEVVAPMREKILGDAALKERLQRVLAQLPNEVDRAVRSYADALVKAAEHRLPDILADIVRNRR